MTVREKIIELSDQLLTHLLDYRKTHADFRFWLRTKEHNRAGDGERLNKGQWFQGSNYIFLSFHSASGHVNMTRSIGWVVEVDDDLVPHFHLSIVWPTERDQNKIDLYHDIINKLGGFNEITKTKYRKDLPDKKMLDSLNDFLEYTLPQINGLIDQHGLTNTFTIPEEKFRERLDKILSYRERLKPENAMILSTEKSNDMETSTHALNTILYGPPGTGKTYNSITKALEILGEHTGGRSRKEIKDIFDRRQQEGQIVFTTFHQSLSYEDFIEGIKPLKPQAGESIKYDIENGIFKKLCEVARSNYENSRKENREMLPFEDAFEKFKEDWENDPEMKFPLRTSGYEFTIIGFTNMSIQFKKASGGTGHTLSINTLKEQYYGKDFNFNQGVGIYYPGILNKLFSYKSETTQKIALLNYVLIIDEVNRGNVSQIFGELITLIEDDKRLGTAEALTATLPYSKETFSVPPNLYIIGTMNTADRSVEALDTALRRRFSFEPILPVEDLLSPQNLIVRFFNGKYKDTDWNDKEYRRDATKLYTLIGINEAFERTIRQDEKPEFADDDKVRALKDEQFEGVNLKTLLSAINKRLETLLSKDHTIGHAWLMNVYSLEDLKVAFKNKILPLLQEFFYNDYAKIGLVLGEKFVQAKSIEQKFAKFDDELAADYSDKLIYSLKDSLNMKLEDFISIYK
jgi:5-methylcytosine-specific restriction endonuclease McrBC GTP-binding regulatory subunit McrB